MHHASIVAVTKPLVTGVGTADDFVAYAARVSNPSNQANSETAPRLIRYLRKNKHWSPFEMVHAVMEITTSIPRLRALDGGSLRNAVGMETFAAVLLTVNVRHKMRGSLRLQTV